MIKVLGIKIIDRIKEAGLTQEILSNNASVITTRMGFHEVTDSLCSREAYIIIHLKDNAIETLKIKEELDKIGGITIREMIFDGSNHTPVIASLTGVIDILGIVVPKDHNVIMDVQKLLTSYGCSIRTRLGVNEIFFGESAGLIILELTGDNRERILLERDLSLLSGVQVRNMVF